ncbi:MAG TPA: hypothetical protein VMT00_13905 [Thermoanaerobaculia bacterium]|nr:hypothetical protein [Thermoanaerobaculia bacterium]
MNLLRRVASVLIVTILALSLPAFGASFVVPTDRELVDQADAIVVGVVTGASSAREPYITTTYEIALEEIIKGDVSASSIAVKQLGGFVGDVGLFIVGAPAFEQGERILLFLEKKSSGIWVTSGMELGKFSFVRDPYGDALLLRGQSPGHIFGWTAAGAAHVEGSRSAEAFLQFVRETAAGTDSTIEYFLTAHDAAAKGLDTVSPDANPSAFAFTVSGPSGVRPVRWGSFGGGQTFRVNTQGSQPGGTTAATRAAAAWTNETGSNIQLSSATCSGSNCKTHEEAVVRDDGFNSLVYNVPQSFIATLPNSEANSIAWAGVWTTDATHNHPISNEVFYSIKEGEIFIRDGSHTQSFLDHLVTHEAGHFIGLRHSNDGSPSSTSAIMHSGISGGFGSTLQAWDREAAQTVYGDGPCSPSINTHPQSQSISSGQTATMSVSASGAGLSYQWYEGTSGSGTPIPGATSTSYTTPPLTTTTRYHVRVTNTCGTVNSNTATISIAAACVAPSITTQPTGSTILSGQTATLSVQASGTGPLTYQWFESPSTPVGTNSASFTTPPLTENKSYFVRVSNTCGQLNSNTVQVTVTQACVPPSITKQPENKSIPFGSSTTLTVEATGTPPLSFQWYRGAPPSKENPVGTNSATLETGVLEAATSFWVEVSNSCNQPVASSAGTVTVVCTTPAPPAASGPAVVQSNSTFTISWPAVPGSSMYQVEESLSSNFAVLVAQRLVGTLQTDFVHSVPIPPAIPYFYRVFAISACNQEMGPASSTVQVIVEPDPQPEEASTQGFDQTVPFGSNQDTTYLITISDPAGKSGSNTGYTTSTSQPWLTVNPPSGTIPPGGSTTVTVTATSPGLPVGSNTGTVSVTTPTGAPITTVPVSISLVNPVQPTPKNTPPDNALIIPAVAHLDTGATNFVSDVRVANTANQTIKYQVTFTPAGQDGTVTGKQTLIDIAPGQTVALNDIVRQWFGEGILNAGAFGALEIRPLNFDGKTAVPDAINFATIATNRTYAVDRSGTFGQFIPGIPFSRFAGKGQKLSLQQVAQSASYRTNLGLIEGSGHPATVQITIFNNAGQQLDQFVETLGRAEFRQISRVLQQRNITLDDGRIELQVISDTGRITAYASVLDSITDDPFLVTATDPSQVLSDKYIISGAADIKGLGANWRTDMRVFNATASAVQASLIFYPDTSPGSPLTRQITLNPGEVRMMNNLLEATFGVTNTKGAVHVVTQEPTSLVTTARTYDQLDSGTRGQFIGGVTPDAAIGVNDRALQLLQLEQSARYRTNLGITEVTGAAAIVEITAIVPGAAAAPVLTMGIPGNQAAQISRILAQMVPGDTYNARITVKVIGGSGKVVAYASVVDAHTSDPTFVPGQ